MANPRVEEDIQFKVSATSSNTGLIEGFEIDLSNWRTQQDMVEFVDPACNTPANVGYSSCSAVTSGSDYKIRIVNAQPTALSWSIQFLVKMAPHVTDSSEHAASSITCNYYSDTGFTSL